jgi:hypothetical protein
VVQEGESLENSRCRRCGRTVYITEVPDKQQPEVGEREFRFQNFRYRFDLKVHEKVLEGLSGASFCYC